MAEPDLTKSDLALWLEAEFAPKVEESERVLVQDGDAEREGVVQHLDRVEHSVTEDEWHVLVQLDGDPDGLPRSFSTRCITPLR